MKKIFFILSLFACLFCFSQTTGVSVPFYVGQLSVDPSGTIKDGTLYYNTTNHSFRARINGAWVDMSSGGSSFSARELKFKTGVTTNAPASGDSILVYTGSSAKKLNIYREGELQFDSFSSDGYERNVDTITFHPPLLANERIIIQAFDSSAWAYDTLVASGGGGAEYLAITTTNLTESPTGTWGNSTETATGRTTLSLSGNGYIEMQYLNATTNNKECLGLDDDNTNEFYTAWKWGVVPIGGTYYLIENGTTPSTLGSAVVGDIIRVSRTGSTITIVINGSTVHTFTTTSSATLTGKVELIDNSTKVSELKGLGFN